MHAWLNYFRRSAEGAKRNRKNRQPRLDRRLKCDALMFGLECLEDRVLLAADLAMDKSVAPTGAVVPGELLTYTIHAQNLAAGTTAATGVVVTDTLPAGETFVDATVSGSGAPTVSGSGSTVTANLGTLSPGSADTIIVRALVNTTASGTLMNSASMTNTSGDANPANATASNTVSTTAPTNNVSVTKDSLPSNFTGAAGALLFYDVTVTNNASAAASGVMVVDRLDPNETFVSASDANGDTFTNVGGTITGTISSLAGFGSEKVRIVAIPTTAAGVAGSVTNTAIVAVPGGNLSTNNVAAKTNVVNPAPATAPNVSVTKDSAPSNATGIVGAALTYHVTLTNNTSTPATGASAVDVFDRLDPNETFVSASDANGSSFNFSAGTISGAVNLAGNSVDTITIVAIPTTAAGVSGSVTNTAAIAIFGGNLSTNTVAAKTNAVTAASPTGPDVSVTKDSVPSDAVGAIGSPLTYHVTITNNKAAAAANVQLTDVLDVNEKFVSATDTNGDAFTNDAGTITGTIASLAGNSADTVTIVATPFAGAAGAGHVTNTATIAVPSGNVSTNFAATKTNTVTAAPPQASLSITKTAPTTGAVGTNLAYTITVANAAGAASAADVTMTDILPPGVTFVSATDTSGGAISNTGTTVTDVIGTLAAGATDVITIIVTPGSSLAGQSVTNTANVSATNFNGGAAIASSASTSISGTTVVSGVGFLAGMPGDGTPQTFVQNLYRELLGREPDSVGDSFWINYLTQHNNAAGQAQAIQAFLNSQEYAIHYITTLYHVILGRAPDAPSLQYWTSRMGRPGTPGGAAGSADEKAIVAAFFGSDEFYIKAGNTPQNWINAVYEDVFGRAADGQGLAFWTNELTIRGAGDRDGIIRDLLSSPEAAHLVLDSFYPAAGGTNSHPLAVPGAPAGAGSTELATITGDGWENLFLQGPYDSQPQGSDSFFSLLAGGAGWDDVQLLLLKTSQFFTNPNRPITN